MSLNVEAGISENSNSKLDDLLNSVVLDEHTRALLVQTEALIASGEQYGVEGEIGIGDERDVIDLADSILEKPPSPSPMLVGDSVSTNLDLHQTCDDETSERILSSSVLSSPSPEQAHRDEDVTSLTTKSEDELHRAIGAEAIIDSVNNGQGTLLAEGASDESKPSYEMGKDLADSVWDGGNLGRRRCVDGKGDAGVVILPAEGDNEASIESIPQLDEMGEAAWSLYMDRIDALGEAGSPSRSDDVDGANMGPAQDELLEEDVTSFTTRGEGEVNPDAGDFEEYCWDPFSAAIRLLDRPVHP